MFRSIWSLVFRYFVFLGRRSMSFPGVCGTIALFSGSSSSQLRSLDVWYQEGIVSCPCISVMYCKNSMSCVHYWFPELYHQYQWKSNVQVKLYSALLSLQIQAPVIPWCRKTALNQDFLSKHCVKFRCCITCNRFYGCRFLWGKLLLHRIHASRVLSLN